MTRRQIGMASGCAKPNLMRTWNGLTADAEQQPEVVWAAVHTLLQFGRVYVGQSNISKVICDLDGSAQEAESQSRDSQGEDQTLGARVGNAIGFA